MIWLNGEVLPLAEARIGVEDRGFQFADGVYEVVRIYNGRAFTLAEHLDRLERSCDGIRLKNSLSKAELTREISRFIERSPVREGMIYLQITRGLRRGIIFLRIRSRRFCLCAATACCAGGGDGGGVEAVVPKR